MKRFLVIECDTEYNAVFVHEVTREFTSEQKNGRGVAYHRDPSTLSVICDDPGPRFYGKLDALLLTRNRVEKAAPIEPETMVERVERVQDEPPEHVEEFLAAPVEEES